MSNIHFKINSAKKKNVSIIFFTKKYLKKEAKIIRIEFDNKLKEEIAFDCQIVHVLNVETNICYEKYFLFIWLFLKLCGTLSVISESLFTIDNELHSIYVQHVRFLASFNT